MDEDHRLTLAGREPIEGARKPRLDPGLVLWCRLGKDHLSTRQESPGPTAADPIEITDRILHDLDPLPVFPAVDEGVDSGLPSSLRAIGSHECDAEKRLRLAVEDGIRIVVDQVSLRVLCL
jgi:hypothetical protein